MKKVCVVGASGLIGQALVKTLLSKGYTVLETSVRSDPVLIPDSSWESKIAEADFVINLAGASIFSKRWNDLVKSEIYDSRVEGTKLIVSALKKAKDKNRE